MLPTLELMLRHAIQYNRLKGSAAVIEPGNLDSISRFLADMRRLSQPERTAVLSVHLLAQLLDGDLAPEEFALWGRIRRSVLVRTGVEEEEGRLDLSEAQQAALQQQAVAFRSRQRISAASIAKALWKIGPILTHRGLQRDESTQSPPQLHILE